jgi:hypothetical protein
MTAMSDGDPRFMSRLEAFRGMRETVERAVLPMATSVDGFAFTFQASLHGLELRRGGYVTLESEGSMRLGLVTDLAAERVLVSDAGDAPGQVEVRLARGVGLIVEGDGLPFHDATVGPADPVEVEAWQRRERPERGALPVGELLRAPGVEAMLDARGFTRHTFMCGQSGSGKTYALGVLLERILMQTSLRLVILDPNSDHVGLARVRLDANPDLTELYGAVPGQVAAWTDDAAADRPLRLTFPDLPPALQAAILGLDPIADREEYAALGDLLRRRVQGRPLVSGVADLIESDDVEQRRLGLRAANLGVLDWSIWDPKARSLVEEIRNPTSRCTVVDLGSLATVQEQRLVAAAVLSTLWESRLRREPCLVVVDEAHNVGPANPQDPVTALSAQILVQIAAEGRKYGLHLFVATQRPNKLDSDVVSQCDNLVLMRMSSDADLSDLGRLLSFVPRGLLDGATQFRMGEALVAGRLLRFPAYVRMGSRVSEEGGADIPTTWTAGAAWSPTH